ncbi:MAG: hypothetical protein ACHQJ6_02085 [Candidatus Berkiellales bacterium]
MQELMYNEIDLVRGGTAEVVVLFLGVGAVAMLSTFFSNYNCGYVKTPFTTSTPVYDPITHEFLGTQVNEYVKTDFVCNKL